MKLEGHVSLSIKQKILRDGKEGCARETQEGCPAPFFLDLLIRNGLPAMLEGHVSILSCG